MSNPLIHAERSARRWGGTADDYLSLHQWLDSTQTHFPDVRHRMILHNSFGISLAEQVFGMAIVNSADKRVFVREIAARHILEDVDFIPTLADCLQELPIRPWMAGAKQILRGRTSLTDAGQLTKPPPENNEHTFEY